MGNVTVGGLRAFLLHFDTQLGIHSRQTQGHIFQDPKHHVSNPGPCLSSIGAVIGTGVFVIMGKCLSFAQQTVHPARNIIWETNMGS